MTLSTHEDTLAWTQMFKFILGVTKGASPFFRMADGAWEISKAGKEVGFVFLLFCAFVYMCLRCLVRTECSSCAGHMCFATFDPSLLPSGKRTQPLAPPC